MKDERQNKIRFIWTIRSFLIQQMTLKWYFDKGSIPERAGQELKVKKRACEKKEPVKFFWKKKNGIEGRYNVTLLEK